MSSEFRSTATRFAAILMAAAALAACGQSSNGAAGAGGGNSFTQAFDASFNKAFLKSTHDSCLTGAVAHGAPADAAERYCSCVVTQITPLSVKEKQALNGDEAKMTQIAEACKTQATGG